MGGVAYGVAKFGFYVLLMGGGLAVPCVVCLRGRAYLAV